jgi:branched-chain amino acid transport system substrate-binding protein
MKGYFPKRFMIVGMWISLLFVAYHFVPTHARAAGEKEVGTIKVVLSTPMSGPGTAWGVGSDRGMMLAVEEVNEKGGVVIKGKRYMFSQKTYDHAYDPTKGVEIAKRAIDVDKANFLFILGGGIVVACLPFVEQAKIINPHASSGKSPFYFNQKPVNYTFRMHCCAFPDMAILVWGFMKKEHPEIKTVAGIYPDDVPGWDDADAHKKYLPNYGVQLVGQEFYKRGTQDFYPILNKIVSKNPDCIAMGSDPPGDQGRIIKQARELGYKGLMISEASGMYLQQAQIAGAAAEGFLAGACGILPEINPAAPEALKAQYKKWVARWGADSYDALGTLFGETIHMLAQAIEKAQTLDPDKLMEVLRTSEFNVYGLKVRMGGTSTYGYKAEVLSPQSVVESINGKPVLRKVMEFPPGY